MGLFSRFLVPAAGHETERARPSHPRAEKFHLHSLRRLKD
jgi:hypothetical protein